MELHGAANQAMIIDPSALSRKPLPTRACLFRLAPQPLWDLGTCQVSVLCVWQWSEKEWQIRMHGAFTTATTKFGSTSSTSMHDWSVVYPGMTNNVDQVRGREIRRTITVKKESNPGKM